MGNRLIRGFMRDHLWVYMLAVGTIGIAELIQVQIPAVIGDFINRLHAGMTYPILYHYAEILVLIACGYVVFFGLGQFTVGRLAREFEGLVRGKLFAQWETMESHYFEKHTVGDLLSHVLNDVPAVREALAGGINQIAQAVFLFAATLVMTLTQINWGLTLISLLPILLIPLIIAKLGPQIRQRSRQVQESLSSMSDLTEESLQSIRLIKSSANEPVEVHRFSETVDTVYSRSMNLVRLNTAFQSLLPLLSGMSFGIALMYGGDLTLHHHISLGAFVAFTVYLTMLVRPLMQFGNVINNFQNASASLVRIQNLLDAQPQILDPPHPEPPPDVGRIELRDLTFYYPDTERPALSHVTLTVPAGSVLGIVGRTGAGKTTLCSILLREIDPPPHSVMIGGVDIRHIRRQDLRELITYVPQDGFLFASSIGENIAFPLRTAEISQIHAAADQAHILDAVQRMPEGFSTSVGEQGSNLSGGQRQRVAIARALIKGHARIVVLDDSLSAVDSGTESEILRAIHRLQEDGLTVIIASHRLSSLRDADHIAVLDQGQVVEYGTPAELLQEDGFYSRLYAMQAQGEVQHG